MLITIKNLFILFFLINTFKINYENLILNYYYFILFAINLDITFITS